MFRAERVAYARQDVSARPFYAELVKAYSTHLELPQCHGRVQQTQPVDVDVLFGQRSLVKDQRSVLVVDSVCRRLRLGGRSQSEVA